MRNSSGKCVQGLAAVLSLRWLRSALCELWLALDVKVVGGFEENNWVPLSNSLNTTNVHQPDSNSFFSLKSIWGSQFENTKNIFVSESTPFEASIEARIAQSALSSINFLRFIVVSRGVRKRKNFAVWLSIALKLHSLPSLLTFLCALNSQDTRTQVPAYSKPFNWITKAYTAEQLRA